MKFNLQEAFMTHIDCSVTELAIDERKIKLPLLSCRRYVAGVSMLDSSDWITSSTPKNWLRIFTPYDPKAPPLLHRPKSIGKQIRFSWQHSCHLKDQQPSKYQFKVTDLTLNRSATTEVSSLALEFRMAQGAKYSFEVRTQHTDAIAAVWNVTAPPLPIPQHFNVVPAAATSNTFKLDWEAVDVQETT